MRLFFWKHRYRFGSDSEAFDRYLSTEIGGSEMLRSNILIGLFFLLSVGVLLGSLVDLPIFQVIKQNRIHVYLIIFFVCILLYELTIRLLIQRAIRTKSNTRLQYLRYGNAFEEASIPTIGIWLLAVLYDPQEALLGPGAYMYFIFILLGALRLDFRLSLFTGVVAAIEFYALGVYLYWSGPSQVLSPFMSVSMISKSLMMAFAGFITGITTLEIRSLFPHYPAC